MPPIAIDTSNISAVSTLGNNFHRGKIPFLEQQETGGVERDESRH
jgi:hypothetical protein